MSVAMTEKKTEHYGKQVAAKTGGYVASAGGGAYFGGKVATEAAYACTGKSAATAITTRVNASLAEGPAAIVSVPCGIAGEWVGGQLANSVGCEKGGAVETTVKTGGGLGASAAGGAAIGSFAGPGGAAAGAAVGAVGYGVGKGVEGALWLTEGEEGSVRIHNESDKTVTFYSYNRQDASQWVSSGSLVLIPGQFGYISATNGILNFGTECSFFYIHVYINDVCKTTGYGCRVRAGCEYNFKWYQNKVSLTSTSS